jgi:hypothetical protein
MRRATHLIGAVLIAVGVVLFATGGGVRAQTAPPPASLFQLSARADTVGEQVIATGFPVVPAGNIAFVTLASAQASLDTTTSQAFASAPYPGDFVTSLPSTVNGLGNGVLPPFPSFPFYVASSNPTSPKTGQQVGPYQVTATSDDHSSQGDSLIGLSTLAPQVASGTSHASVSRDPNSGQLTAEADSHIAPLAINNLLSIGDIHSHVKLVYDPASPAAGVKKQAAYSIGTITIGGIEVGLTDKGLSLAGKTLLPVDLSALQKLLQGSGVTIAYIPATHTPTSITSSAVEITYHNAKLPAPFLDTTLRFVLGQATASADPGATIPSAGDVGSTGGSGDTSGASGGAALANSGSSGGATGGAGTGAAPTGDLGGTAPSAPSLAAGIPTTGARPPIGTRQLSPRRLIRAPQTNLSNFYLVFIGAGLAALASSRLVQWIALRGRLNPTP